MVNLRRNRGNWSQLLATCLKAKIPAEKRQHIILESIRYLSCVSAGINFEPVRDPILIENIMQLAGISSQTVLVTDIDRDSMIAV
jgi:hypothetical protein